MRLFTERADRCSRSLGIHAVAMSSRRSESRRALEWATNARKC